MKVTVVGTRGFPNVQGGIETHCRELYPRLVAMGADVTVIRRKPYINDSNRLAEFEGVRFKDIYAPRNKYLETIVHTFFAIIYARSFKPDILHIHAMGPSLLVPLGRLLGMKIVMTHHGADYNRDKWGFLAKKILRLGEKAGVTRSNAVIAISGAIKRDISEKYNRSDINVIHNGVNQPKHSSVTSYITELGLTPGRYIVSVGRFVKEKGFDDLIDAFGTVAKLGYKLVIAGDADLPDSYSESLKRKANETSTVLTGFIQGEQLRQLVDNAALFAMTSYHEGLPIALLEALSFGLDVVVSDIEANRLACLEEQDFYRVGDVADLARKLLEKLSMSRRRRYDLSPYDWNHISRQTLDVYNRVLNSGPKPK